jgi:hypothetical protein
MRNLYIYLRLVEATGSEVGVTLLVSGVLITGILTPWARYTAWTKEITMRAVHERGPQGLPDVPMGPITPEITERVRAQWKADAAEAGMNPDDFEPEYREFALRDVEIRAGMKPLWAKAPYLVLATSEVAAFTPLLIPQPNLGF